MKANPRRVLLFLLPWLLIGCAPLEPQVIPPATDLQLPAPERPVLLLPGWFGGSLELSPLKERLVRDGWPEDWVLALDFEDSVGSNLDHAREAEEAMDSLLGRTGAESLDVVAHSMGGLALWVLLQEKGDILPIRRVVFLGSPLQGTLVAHLAWGEGGEEMRPGSEFLERLEAGARPGHWVEAVTLRTPLDMTVVPNSGGTLPGMGDQMVCCPTHQGLQDHEMTFHYVRGFLLEGREGLRKVNPLTARR